MDRFLFLREWEHFSGVTLSDEGRKNFLCECTDFMYYGDKILKEALAVAKKNRNFDLHYIQSVASKFYENERKMATDQRIDTGTSCSFSFSGLSSGLPTLSVGDYYEARERRNKRRI